MPLKRCQINNQKGWKWGDEGKCYVGEDAKEKALKQGQAIGDYELETYNDYPKSASENACKVIRWREEHGDEVEGMTRVGWTRANQLCKRENISRDTIARMASFKRHQKNAEISEEYKGTPWKDKGYVAWLGWGGTEGIEWAQRKLDQIEKLEKINNIQVLQRKVKVGFDYDDTLTKYKVRELVKKLITAGGTEVYIVSARSSSFELYRIAQELGIPTYRVFFTGSNEKKIEKVKQLGLDRFFDNNPEVIKELPNVGVLVK